MVAGVSSSQEKVLGTSIKDGNGIEDLFPDEAVVLIAVKR